MIVAADSFVRRMVVAVVRSAAELIDVQRRNQKCCYFTVPFAYTG
jgi:uncharacterized tellurite resistance protein B-like protein